MQEVKFPFPTGPTIGTLLAVPNVVDATKPVIIAIHGHELSHRGITPWQMFESWAEEFVQAGYVVFAPSHLWYDQLAPLYEAHDYHFVWTRMVGRLLDAVLPLLPEHHGLAVTGLSSGGMTASVLMAVRSDIDIGVFAGMFMPLEFFRRNYRIVGHPDQWDLRSLLSYTALWALIAPNPVQFQLGRRDDFYPSTEPIAPKGNWFPGTPRGIITEELVGSFLMLERIWMRLGGTVDLYIWDGGHAMDAVQALDFIAAQQKKILLHNRR